VTNLCTLYLPLLWEFYVVGVVCISSMTTTYRWNYRCCMYSVNDHYLPLELIGVICIPSMTITYPWNDFFHTFVMVVSFELHFHLCHALDGAHCSHCHVLASCQCVLGFFYWTWWVVSLLGSHWYMLKLEINYCVTKNNDEKFISLLMWGRLTKSYFPRE